MSVEFMQRELNQFIEQINETHQRLKAQTREIEQKEELIQHILNRLVVEIPVQKQETALQQVTALLNNDIMSGVELSIQYLKDMTERKSFVDQFDESLVLMVFGSVNSGKSTLGNFLSGEPIRAAGYEFGQVPTFYRYTDMLEQSTEAVEIESFREGRTETTSEIQHFTLEKGLTWVDTPGILSMTKENENLAKHYVELADLVLIVTSSSAPAKASELKNFTKLINKGKEVVILITKSDMSEMDEINGKIIYTLQPKSIEDRVLQETYIKEQLELADLEKWNGTDVKSISIQLANEALKTGNNNIYESSQVREVFELIGEKLNSDALRLKQNRPRLALNQWIYEIETGNEFIIGLNPLIQQLEDKKCILQERYDAFAIETEKVKSEIRSKVNLKMDEWMIPLYENGKTDEEILKNIHQIQPVLIELVSSYVEKALNHVVEEHSREMRFEKSEKLNLQVDRIYKEIETTDYIVGNRLRDPKGILEHFGAFVFNKEYTESYIKEKKSTKRVVIGNNAKVQLERARNQIVTHFIAQLEQQMDEIQRTVLSGSIELLEQLIRKMIQTKVDLNDIRYEEKDRYDNIHA